MNPFLHSTVALPLHHVGLALGALGLAAAGLAAPALAQSVDVNTASPAQLQTIRGIGPKTADIIVEERKRAGPYESLEDLSDRVKGIGPKKAAGLQAAGLSVGQGAGGSAASSVRAVPGRP